jgi:hypothetical protein
MSTKDVDMYVQFFVRFFFTFPQKPGAYAPGCKNTLSEFYLPQKTQFIMLVLKFHYSTLTPIVFHLSLRLNFYLNFHELV